MKTIFVAILLCVGCLAPAQAQSKHSPSSRYPAYEGKVMCGYQGWFRTPDDGAHEGWVHYSVQGKFDSANVHLDFWPDVSDYTITYPTALTNQDGTTARVFSSWDQSTTDLHFQWMAQYGIDGVFVQRFFSGLRTQQNRQKSRVVLAHALKASQKYGRAISVMYDLSGLKTNDDCSAVIQDWKELVDELKITSQGTNQTYLYDQGRPIVAIWGIGFPDRSYNIHEIGIEKLIHFLKDDPQYGGCAVMLGVPTNFRSLNKDCVADPYLHQIMTSADIILPWMVGRYTPFQPDKMARYETQIKADIAWCTEHRLKYVPCVYPGYSSHNLSKDEFKGRERQLNQIPRQKGLFYWDQISAATDSGAKMLYVAMFDEMDEGTAIFKCSNNPPVGPQLCDYEGVPTDYYLWLTGQAGKMLRKEIPFSKQAPLRLVLGQQYPSSPQSSPAAN